MGLPAPLFHQIVRDWYDPLYRFAFSLCRDPDDACDLTQTTFYKLASKGVGETGSFPEPVSFPRKDAING